MSCVGGHAWLSKGQCRQTYLSSHGGWISVSNRLSKGTSGFRRRGWRVEVFWVQAVRSAALVVVWWGQMQGPFVYATCHFTPIVHANHAQRQRHSGGHGARSGTPWHNRYALCIGLVQIGLPKNNHCPINLVSNERILQLVMLFLCTQKPTQGYLVYVYTN